ncbi:MAG: DNA repair protein RecO [Tissierellia bacterium]|nr:DNA repair protein RecO [Tissierellia bacterium]
MHVKTEGIVLKEYRFKETSKILTLFTRKYGKVHALARGAYRPKSKLLANTQPFSYNDYQLYKGRNFFYINQADIIDSFYNIRENIYKMMYGSYLLELVELSLLEEEENERIFLLLIKGLKVLSTINGNFYKFIISYELKFISFLGYKPEIENCTICGRKKISHFKFSIDKGGLVCPNCFVKDPYSISMDESMRRAMNILLYTPLDKLDSLKIPKDIMFKLHDLLVKYILNKTDRKQFNSLKILESINFSGGD